MEWKGEWNGREWNRMEMGQASEIPANVPARMSAPKPREHSGECNGMKWIGREWIGVKWNRKEWNGVERTGSKYSA